MQMWAKRTIYNKVEAKAHSKGIRISRVSARNTSILAFDGSGKVSRNSKNYSLCTFTSGKQYNCDLSASYNIGARYFIRKIEKTIPETEWLQLQAKVPALARRTQCTLSTLKSIVA
ncbi:MAG: transposase [Peptostreptococcaceae bacterium]|nr:transposase [Peptostreptococcaceae bacterium]